MYMRWVLWRATVALTARALSEKSHMSQTFFLPYYFWPYRQFKCLSSASWACATSSCETKNCLYFAERYVSFIPCAMSRVVSRTLASRSPPTSSYRPKRFGTAPFRTQEGRSVEIVSASSVSIDSPENSCSKAGCDEPNEDARSLPLSKNSSCWCRNPGSMG